MTTLFEVLNERGFVSQCSDEGLPGLLEKQKFTVYAGFDPTADSLHLGHLVPVMGLAHFQKTGHKVIMVVGGATGMVGDPSGRSDERNLLTSEQIANNVRAVRKQLECFLDFTGPNPATIVDNNDWIGPMTFIDWLREVGKYFTIGYMMAKDSVKNRLESEKGLSYTEFSYMTMQAYDFLHLYDTFGCTLQVGGNDQWGNITAGIDLIRRLRQVQAYGLTFPLITTSSGEKFGKSAGNALWLDVNRTSPWDFYQYLFRQLDTDVIRFLNLYTFLPLERIQELEQAVKERPNEREAQKALAYEVTRMVHGKEVADEIVHAAEVVYYSEIKGISEKILAAAFASVPSTTVTRAQLEAGIDLLELFSEKMTNLTSSKGEARRLLKAGGIYVNNVRQEKEGKIGPQHLASESFIVLRSGKKNYHLVKVQ
jgi:tyrosyl-tRNA synthetase